MQIKFYEIDDNFIQEYKTWTYTEYIKEYFEDTGIKLYFDMKKFYESQSKNLPTLHYVFFLFNDNDVIVGYKYLYLNIERKYTEFFSTAIDPAYRKQGYAKQMIKKALDFIESNNIFMIDVPLIKNQELKIYMLKDLYAKLKADYLNLEFNIKYV